MITEFTIPGQAVPQGRPRARIIGRGQNKRIMMYDPKESKEYKEYAALIARQYAPKTLYEAELSVDLDIYRQIPKSTTKRKRELYNARLIRPTVKPDLDNYSKSILDALNGIMYKDDSQIVDLNISKYYSDDPRVEVRIKELIPHEY